MLRAAAVRVGLTLLAALHLWWGGWARVAPRHFYDTFPGLGERWTAAYPPYNEHLVTDLGATFLTLGFLLVVAAVSAEPRVRRTVLAGVALFGALHLAFHATDRGDLGGPSYGASVAALVVGVLLPAALLALDRLPRPQRPDRDGHPHRRDPDRDGQPDRRDPDRDGQPDRRDHVVGDIN